MSKSKEKLSPPEWQARHDAACAIVARKYCDMFEFWRACRYKPCRSARRCRGDQGVCLESRWHSVPYDAAIAAEIRMAAETPPDADRFTRAAHYYTPCSLCPHKSEKSEDPRPTSGPMLTFASGSPCSHANVRIKRTTSKYQC